MVHIQVEASVPLGHELLAQCYIGQVQDLILEVGKNMHSTSHLSRLL